jgi:hypothetical protein
MNVHGEGETARQRDIAPSQRASRTHERLPHKLPHNRAFANATLAHHRDCVGLHEKDVDVTGRWQEIGGCCRREASALGYLPGEEDGLQRSVSRHPQKPKCICMLDQAGLDPDV